jgi:hypothetical protein
VAVTSPWKPSASEEPLYAASYCCAPRARTHLHVPAPLVAIRVAAVLPAVLLAHRAEDPGGVVVHGDVGPLVGVRPLLPPFLHHLLLLGVRRQAEHLVMLLPLLLPQRRCRRWQRLRVRGTGLPARDEEALVVVGGDDGVVRRSDGDEVRAGERGVVARADLEVDLLADAPHHQVVLPLRLPQEVDLIHGRVHAERLDSPLAIAGAERIRLAEMGDFGTRVWRIRQVPRTEGESQNEGGVDMGAGARRGAGRRGRERKLSRRLAERRRLQRTVRVIC